MRRGWILAAALALLLSSAVLGWMAWERGEVELYLLLIFPVLKAEGAYGAASLLLTFAALVVIVVYFLTHVSPGGAAPAGRASVGGVVMIGPIPIVLGTDRRAAVLAMVLALIVLMMMVLFLVR